MKLSLTAEQITQPRRATSQPSDVESADLLLECDDEDVDELDLVLEHVDQPLDGLFLLHLEDV